MTASTWSAPEQGAPLRVHMIMPVGSDENYELKRSVVDEVANDTGVDFHFPLDHVQSGGFNLRAALARLGSADLVIADLALERPSCYYELGLAQAVGCRTILIAPTGTPLHQAAFRDAARFYSDLPGYTALLHEILSLGRGSPR